MPDLTNAEIEAIKVLASKATPFDDSHLIRYEHGGGRLAILSPPDRRDLLADFYDEANREYFAACPPDRILALANMAQRAAGMETDYFGELIAKARTSAAKAAIKFPQPNYVTLKIAEEAGEVVRGAVHYAENRMEWSEVEGEIVQLLAMLIRFVTEGDQVNGVTPPARILSALQPHEDAQL